MISHEHTDPHNGALHIVNLENVLYVELQHDAAHIRIVFGDHSEVNLNCTSAEKAKSEYIQIRRTMSGVT